MSSKLTYANDTQRYSYLDLHTEIVPFIRSNIPASSAYGVYAPQLIRYYIACAQNSDVLYRTQPLTQKLIKQVCAVNRLKSSLHNVYGGHPNLVDRCEIYINQMTMIFYILHRCFLSPITSKTFTRIECKYE